MSIRSYIDLVEAYQQERQRIVEELDPLTERADMRPPLKWQKINHNKVRATFNIGDLSYWVSFEKSQDEDDESYIVVSFSIEGTSYLNKTGKFLDKPFAATGTGNARLVLETVFSAIVTYARRKRPETILFSGEGTGRQKAYNLFCKQIAPEMEQLGYKLSMSNSSSFGMYAFKCDEQLPEPSRHLLTKLNPLNLFRKAKP